jgi:hypothetical protein
MIFEICISLGSFRFVFHRRTNARGRYSLGRNWRNHYQSDCNVSHHFSELKQTSLKMTFKTFIIVTIHCFPGQFNFDSNSFFKFGRYGLYCDNLNNKVIYKKCSDYKIRFPFTSSSNYEEIFFIQMILTLSSCQPTHQISHYVRR